MKRLLFALAAVLAVCVASCSDGDPAVTKITPSSTTGDSFTLPSGYEAADSAIMTVKNIATGVETTYEVAKTVPSIVVEDGLYDISLTVYTTRSIGNNASVQQVLRDIKSNVKVSGGTLELTFSPVAVVAGQGFLFAEVCLAPKLADGVKMDLYSSWFRIVNSSADTLDADGLCIIQSKFVTNLKYDYTPDIMSEAVAVDAIYRIPATGLRVAPGETILIADQAINHQETNALSFDLSNADFEWYDETEKNLDIDNPDVPNMERVYCNTKTVWIPNSQGYKVFGLAFISTDDEEYLEKYVYDYSWIQVSADIEKEMAGSCYMVPNDWIVDCITFSPSTLYQWNITSSSLDAGYVSIGKTGADKDRLGKSARRKVQDGKFVDTNDSSNDFDVVEADPAYQF